MLITTSSYLITNNVYRYANSLVQLSQNKQLIKCECYTEIAIRMLKRVF